MDHEREDRRLELDPMARPGRWEDLVAGIVARARPELARRRARVDVPGIVVQWARPALATAATVALLVTAAAVVGGPGSEGVAGDAMLAGALVPESYAAWLVAGYEPTVTELVVALEEVGR